jgi:hypothetical protein
MSPNVWGWGEVAGSQPMSTAVHVEPKSITPFLTHTDKKENQIFLIYKEIRNGAVAKLYITDVLLTFGEIFTHFLIF